MVMTVKASAFLQLGMQIMGWTKRKEITQRRRFKSHFGATPEKCSTVWRLLCQSTAKQGLPYDQIGKPEHLLWGLMLLKMYGTEITMAAKVGTDEKTFCKRLWQVVEAIATLAKHLVSNYGFIITKVK
jgi:hypothetical protein